MLVEAVVLAALCAPGKAEPYWMTHTFLRAPGVHPREYHDPHAYPPLESHHQVELIREPGAPIIRVRMKKNPQTNIYRVFYHSVCTAVG